MARPDLTPLEHGIIIGLLIGEGHFGGDGKNAQITVKMHVRHEQLLRWLQSHFPRTKLYGPYSYDGRNFYQWMARGSVLAQDVLPVLDQQIFNDLDAHSGARLSLMREKYAAQLQRLA